MRRRKITVTGSGEHVRAAALLLCLRDDAELVLLGEDAAPLHAAAVPLGYTARASGPDPWEEAGGSDLVVLLDEVLDAAAVAAELATRCPDAILVIATPEPAAAGAALQDALRWPRQRLLGVAPGVAAAGPWALAAGAAQLVDFVLADRREELDATVLHQGEHGLEGFHCTTVEVGGDGITAFAVG